MAQIEAPQTTQRLFHQGFQWVTGRVNANHRVFIDRVVAPISQQGGREIPLENLKPET